MWLGPVGETYYPILPASDMASGENFLEWAAFGNVRPRQGPQKVGWLLGDLLPDPPDMAPWENRIFSRGRYFERSDLRYGSWVERSGVKFLCNLGLAFLSLER